ncbi:hypothetical protein HC928_06005 [bacterium]|nr:hypothetical protein [bacterium]
MAKDKLITIRVEQEIREAFKDWSSARKFDASAFLYEVIRACLDGKLDESIVKEERIDSLDGIDEWLGQQLDDRIAAVLEQHPALMALTSRLEDVEARAEAIAEGLTATATLGEQLHQLQSSVETLRQQLQAWERVAQSVPSAPELAIKVGEPGGDDLPSPASGLTSKELALVLGLPESRAGSLAAGCRDRLILPRRSPRSSVSGSGGEWAMNTAGTKNVCLKENSNE